MITLSITKALHSLVERVEGVRKSNASKEANLVYSNLAMPMYGIDQADSATPESTRVRFGKMK